MVKQSRGGRITKALKYDSRCCCHSSSCPNCILKKAKKHLVKNDADPAKRLYRCPFCGKELKGIRAHIEQQHLRPPALPKLRICPRCTFKCLHSFTLKRHLNVVHGVIDEGSAPHRRNSSSGSFHNVDVESRATPDDLQSTATACYTPTQPAEEKGSVSVEIKQEPRIPVDFEFELTALNYDYYNSLDGEEDNSETQSSTTEEMFYSANTELQSNSANTELQSNSANIELQSNSANTELQSNSNFELQPSSHHIEELLNQCKPVNILVTDYQYTNPSLAGGCREHEAQLHAIKRFNVKKQAAPKRAKTASQKQQKFLNTSKRLKVLKEKLDRIRSTRELRVSQRADSSTSYDDSRTSYDDSRTSYDASRTSYDASRTSYDADTVRSDYSQNTQFSSDGSEAISTGDFDKQPRVRIEDCFKCSVNMDKYAMRPSPRLDDVMMVKVCVSDVFKSAYVSFTQIPPDDEHKITYAALYTLIALCSVVLNISVIILIIRLSLVIILIIRLRNNKERPRTDRFVLSLAISDLLISIFVIPLHIKRVQTDDNWSMGDNYRLNDITCKASMFVQMFAILSSMFTLTALSLERYWSVCGKKVTKLKERKRNIIMIVLVWPLSAVLSIHDMYFTEVPLDKTRGLIKWNNTLNYLRHELYFKPNRTVWLNKQRIVYSLDKDCLPAHTKICTLNIGLLHYHISNIAALIICYVIPVLIMVFCYGKILSKLCRTNLATSALARQKAGNKLSASCFNISISKRKIRHTIIITLLVAMYVILWGPYFLYTTIFPFISEWSFGESHPYDWRIDLFKLITYIGTAFNPIIYMCSSALLENLCFCRQKNNQGQVTPTSTVATSLITQTCELEGSTTVV